MTTILSKPLTRELTKYPGVIVTLTENGIDVKVKRRHKSIHISWEMIFGAGAMERENRDVMIRGADIVLRVLGYAEYLQRVEQGK